MPSPQKGLDCNIRKLVGSFCKKHAVTLRLLSGLRLVVGVLFAERANEFTNIAV